MTYPVRVSEEELWFRRTEALLKQHKTDIQRLWKRMTQTPQAFVGQQAGSPQVDIKHISGTGTPQGSGSLDASGSPNTGTGT